jgi:arginase
VPGTAKAPEALREAGLHRRFAERGAMDAGVVLPGRYVDDDATRPTGFVRNETALVDHARRLADRLVALSAAGHAPLVLGGDCSLLVGIGMANARTRRAGLVHLDGHTDFRHPGGGEPVASVAGRTSPRPSACTPPRSRTWTGSDRTSTAAGVSTWAAARTTRIGRRPPRCSRI